MLCFKITTRGCKVDLKEYVETLFPDILQSRPCTKKVHFSPLQYTVTGAVGVTLVLTFKALNINRKLMMFIEVVDISTGLKMYKCLAATKAEKAQSSSFTVETQIKHFGLEAQKCFSCTWKK